MVAGYVRKTLSNYDRIFHPEYLSEEKSGYTALLMSMYICKFVLINYEQM